MRKLASLRAAVFTGVMACVAPQAVAQEMSDAQIETFVREQCTHSPRSARDTRTQEIDLVVTPPEIYLSRIEDQPSAWEQPGFLVYTWMMNRETGFTSITPLSAVTATAERRGRPLEPIDLTATLARMSCIDDEECGVALYTDGDVRPSEGAALQCHNPERVIEALDAWVDRHVTRMDSAPPFSK